MKHIFEKIADLSKEPIEFSYKGDSYLLNVEFKEGKPKEEILAEISKAGLIFNEDVIAFYEKYNGIYFFRTADCGFNSLEEAIQLSSMPETREIAINKKMLHIGSYFGDYIFMDCSHAENRIYFSLEGIDEHKFTGYTFKEFIKQSLDTNFLGIWETWDKM